MSAEIVVRRKAPAVEVDSQIAPSILMRDTCAIVGPRIIREHSSVIDGKTYIHVSGATLLAGIFGYHVREVRVRRIEIGDVGAWEATAEIVRASDGVVLGRGSSICCDDERGWSKRPQFARRAMASTRAAGRALRLFFGHAMTMLGDNVATTTREEMPDDHQ